MLESEALIWKKNIECFLKVITKCWIWLRWSTRLLLKNIKFSLDFLKICVIIVALKLWRGIEVVITGLTRNQFARNRTGVRIPLSPPQTENPPNMVDFLFVMENSMGFERSEERARWAVSER